LSPPELKLLLVQLVARRSVWPITLPP
jgi:hypothetical protein